MSTRRDYDLFKEHKLSNFFLLVFLFIAAVSSYWYFHRRTNYSANQNVDGVDVAAPFYETRKSAELGEQHPGEENATPEENEVKGGENNGENKEMNKSEGEGEHQMESPEKK